MKCKGPLHIFLIVIDTLRDDYSQLLDKDLKRMGFVRYENVIAPSPWTLPSHVSMFTGLYPILHKSHETRTRKDYGIRVKYPELSFVHQLANLGYSTYLLSSNIYVTPYFGFKGFDEFFDTTVPYFISRENSEKISRILNVSQRKPFRTLKEFINRKEFSLLTRYSLGYIWKQLKWPRDKGATTTLKIIEKNIFPTLRPNAPVFMFVNLMEVHEPYSRFENSMKLKIENRRGYPAKNTLIRKWRKGYKNEIKYLNKVLRNLIRQLLTFEDSLIIVTSDHGQLLGEYGLIGHGTFLHDELLRVPFWVRYPENITISESDDKYISLTKIRDLVKSATTGRLKSDAILYSDAVFAESYGIPERIIPTTPKEREYISNLEKYRITMYYKNMKVVYNVTDWKFEKITTYDETNPDNRTLREAKKKIIKFFNTVTKMTL